MSFEFRFKGVSRARLPDVSWEVTPEEDLFFALGTIRSPESESIMHRMKYLV